MATESGIIAVFGILDAAGCRRPSSWSGLDSGGIVQTWVLALSGLSDTEAVAAARVFVQVGSAWYPTPGKLVQSSPTKPKLLTAKTEEWCPEARAYIAEMKAKHGHQTSWGWRRGCNVAERMLEIQDAYEASR